MLKLAVLLLLGAVMADQGASPAMPPEAERQLAREIYKELVEIKSGYTTGATTPVAEAVARRLKAAGVWRRRHLRRSREPGNSVAWLLKNKRELIDAEFCLNEGGWGESVGGKRIANDVQVSEQYVINYRLEVRNKGGHSALPVPDNALYHLAGALDRLSKFAFPLKTNEVTKAYFQAMSKIEEASVRDDLAKVAAGDQGAMERIARPTPSGSESVAPRGDVQAFAPVFVDRGERLVAPVLHALFACRRQSLIQLEQLALKVLSHARLVERAVENASPHELAKRSFEGPHIATQPFSVPGASPLLS